MQFDQLKRRELITLLGGAAAAWPLAARAQQAGRMRRIGVLMALASDDPQGQARLVAFVQGLQELGWTDGRNVRIDTRWAAGDADRFRRYAAELIALAPDVILASGGTGVGALLQATRTVPIVFTQTNDPVGAGYVDSLARPGGNATGFTNMEYGMSGKYLELLKEIAPRMAQAAVLRDPTIPQGIGQFSAIQAVAPSPIPAIYEFREFVLAGGLMSYGTKLTDNYRLAGAYAGRLLKGAKAADLPVQQPTKFLLTISLKTAKELGLTVPDRLLALADEVIE